MQKLLSFVTFIGMLSILPVSCSFWLTQPFTSSQPLSTKPKVNIDLLKQDVIKLSTDYAERSFWEVEILNQAADYIEQRFSTATYKVERQAYVVEGDTFYNIIAKFGPESGKPLIIGAHYDAFLETQGADDNASGVAGLLAIGKLLQDKPPNIPVHLVAYTLEEPPNFRTNAMGSRHHAKSLVTNKIQPSLVIVLEMIGYFRDEPNSQTYPIEQLDKLYPTTGNFIAVVGHLMGANSVRTVKAGMQSATELPIRSINAPSLLSGIDFSDHASYWAHDMPAVMITDTAFYRNTNYHAKGDTADTLDYVRMAEVIKGVYGVINSM